MCDHLNVSYIEQYFHVVLLFVLNKVVLTLNSVDDALDCDHILLKMRAIEQYVYLVLRFLSVLCGVVLCMPLKCVDDVVGC